MDSSRCSALARVRHSAGYVARNARLRRVIAAWAVWITAEWAVVVVVTIAGFELGGTSAVAVLAIVRTLPPGIAAPVLGLLADRVPRQRVVAAVFASWSVLVAAAAVALHAKSLGWLYAVVLAAGIASTLLRPGINGLIPQVVGNPVELALANSVYALVEALGSLIGPLLAGVLIAVLTADAAMLCIAAMFLVGSLLAVTISTEFQPADERSRSWLQAVLEPITGFAVLTGGRSMRALFAVFMAQTFTRGLLNVFFVVIAVRVLHREIDATSILIAALGAGGVLGSLLTLASSGRKPGPLVIIGMLLWGLPLLLIAAAPQTTVTWLALAFIGVGNAIGDVYGYTLMQRLIPDHLLGRAFGAFWGGVAVMQAVGALCAPLLIYALGMRWALVAGGAFMLLVVALGSSSIRAVGEQLSADPTRVAALQRCAVLAPLTSIALEQLARVAAVVDVPARTSVIEQGTLGNSFYVVVEGAFGATVDGRQVRTMAPGDCFGEIAAMRRLPRTASVVALVDGTLLELDGATFVRAVTTHRLATGVAAALSSDRLSSAAARPL